MRRKRAAPPVRVPPLKPPGAPERGRPGSTPLFRAFEHFLPLQDDLSDLVEKQAPTARTEPEGGGRSEHAITSGRPSPCTVPFATPNPAPKAWARANDADCQRMALASQARAIEAYTWGAALQSLRHPRQNDEATSAFAPCPPTQPPASQAASPTAAQLLCHRAMQPPNTPDHTDPPEGS